MRSARYSLRPHLGEAARWVAEHWEKSPWMFNAGGAVLAMAVGMATGIDRIPGRNAFTAIWVLAGVFATVLLVAGPYYLAKRAERVTDLRGRIERLEREKERIGLARERDSADLKSVLDGVGRELLRGCDVDTEDTRVSIYQHHDDEKRFAPVSRTSPNPKLSETGRAAYRDDVGIIATAWQERTAHDRIKYTDPEKWADYQARNHGLDRETASGIAMKSLSYLGVRIDDGDLQVGILVMESKDRDRVTAAHADMVCSHHEFTRIQLMLRAAPRLPLEESSLGADDEDAPRHAA